MPAISETIYPVLLSKYTDKALEINFKPTAADLAFVRSKAKQRKNQFVLLVMLMVSNYLHYIPKLSDVPYALIKYISSFLGQVVLHKKTLVELKGSGTLKRYINAVRDYLKFKNDNEEATKFCFSYGAKITETKVNNVDIINSLIEGMIKENIELLAFSTIERIVQKCRVTANNNLYQSMTYELSIEQIKKIEQFFISGNIHSSLWNKLKIEPNKPTAKNIKDFIEHLNWIKNLADNMPNIDAYPLSRIEQLRGEALALHSSDMIKLKQTKRLALSIVLLKTQLSQHYDDMVEILIKLISDVSLEGKRAYQNELMGKSDRTDELILTFRDFLSGYQASMENSVEERLATIDSIISDNSTDMLEACESHLALSTHGDRPYIISAYRRKRKLIFLLLENLPLASSIEASEIVGLRTVLLSLFKEDKREVISFSLSQSLIEKLSKAWRPLFLVDNEKNENLINRYALEIAWLLTLSPLLKTFHCYIIGGEKFGDPNKQLITEEEYPDLAKEYEAVCGIPTDGKKLVKKLRSELTELSKDIDSRFNDIKGVTIDGDRIKLQRAYTDYQSKTLDALRNAITENMPKTSIIDVITDTVRWLKLDEFFNPHSGNQSRLTDQQLRLVVTLFCYGCNIGPQQTMDSIKGLTRKQIAWLNARHTDIRSLEKSIKKVIAVYAQMLLPKQWGSGEHASADGTHKPMYDANILSEFHFRYRKRGAIGYYMVSDQYVALFSHFIACGVHESWHILDGVARNDMEIQPSILHGDTHAQNYVVFGLSYLLGIELMPRIRGVSHLNFYKPAKRTAYRNIKSIFNETIQWKEIEKALPEMMRIVLSIRAGKVTASTILRRLNTFSYKDQLYKGFQELGKYARTMYLLRFISDIELRKIVHRETNKSEQFNEFSNWLFFGNNGVIRHNDRFEQEKIIKYHHLVSNLVMLYNVHHMGKALEKLKQEGFPLIEEDIKHLSPYQKFSINLLGYYQLNLNKPLEPIKKHVDI